MTEIWSILGPSLRPSQAAALFATGYFDPPRQVDYLKGEWQGSSWFGGFRLVDGERWYELTCDHTGRWSVRTERPT